VEDDNDSAVFNDRSPSSIDPSDSLPDLPFVVCEFCWSSSKSSLSALLMRRLFDAEFDSGVVATCDVRSVADIPVIESFSADGALSVRAGCSTDFFLFALGVAGFFFSPLAVFFFRDLTGRPSGAAGAIDDLSSFDDVLQIEKQYLKMYEKHSSSVL
ncbi:MAG: hypothetical protein IT281_10830, partial [Ignavibacteria bacterium]|nr:hypothetical protein [Ignavibacteria bacterium]